MKSAFIVYESPAATLVPLQVKEEPSSATLHVPATFGDVRELTVAEVNAAAVAVVVVVAVAFDDPDNVYPAYATGIAINSIATIIPISILCFLNVLG